MYIAAGAVAKESPFATLIVNAEVEGRPGLDVRCRGGVVAEIGERLIPAPNELVVHAGGGTLLPGLHDHHIHLPAFAAARRSVHCGPPHAADREELADALRNAPGEGWIRGVGYHESVAGALTPPALDALLAHRPVRIQHRSGKMWFLNSEAIRRLGPEAHGGQLFRRDEWLREQLDDTASETAFAADMEAASRSLSGLGVTGLTETTPTNDERTAARYRDFRLWQHVNLMGDESLPSGSLKLMLDDAKLPTFEQFQARIAAAHDRGRPVAVHCVTRTELVFALAALREAGTMAGDRLEHAAVADQAALGLLRDAETERGHLAVVTQPHFIAERGDQYLRDVPPADHPHLYRCRGFLDADIPLGGGTDAPFGNADPWAAMDAAVTRRTASGTVVGEREALTPEQALALFLAPLATPGGTRRRVAVGCPADLCVLDAPWERARAALHKDRVLATLIGGEAAFARATAVNSDAVIPSHMGS